MKKAKKIEMKKPNQIAPGTAYGKWDDDAEAFIFYESPENCVGMGERAVIAVYEFSHFAKVENRTSVVD